MAKLSAILFFGIISLLISPSPLTGQNTCKVLKPEIAESYDGACKNGLAHGEGKAEGIDVYQGEFKKGLPHGKGTYIWKSGDSYSGEWKKGEMDGKGTMKVVSNEQDTTYTGIWNSSTYEGPVVETPQVRQKTGVDRFSFDRQAEGNRYTVDIYLNGTPNTTVVDFTITSTSGNQYKRGNTIVFDNVTFPVECLLRYKTYNKLHSSLHNVIFNFVIEQAGEWKVEIHN